MAALINLKKEVETLREEVMQALRKNLISKQFNAQILLALVHLHVMAKKVAESQELNERRKLLQKFSRCKKVIEKWVAVLNEPDPNKISTDEAMVSCHTTMGTSHQRKRINV